MRIKKKLLLVAFAAAVFVGATAPQASATSVLCETEATSFNHWFYKQFYCR